MKKKILSLIAILLCMSMLTGCCFHREWNEATCDEPKTCANCGKTEGEPLEHEWEDATCTDSKTCSLCHKTEGKPLGHNWVDATTEAPQTCTNCGETKGERIVTDPRFTTADTKDLQGVWTSDIVFTGEQMGLDGYADPITSIFVQMNFSNDGVMSIAAEIPDVDGFYEKMVEVTAQLTYDQLAAQGLDRASVDSLLLSQYGMDMNAYVRASLTKDYILQLVEALYADVNTTGVYYIADGVLYTGNSWDSEMVAESYSLDGDALIINSFNEGLGMDVAFNRVVE